MNIHSKKWRLISTILFSVMNTTAIANSQTAANTNSEFMTYIIKAQLLVSNIQGISGIRQVSPFHTGGAIPSNPEFLIETLPGKVLDPERLLVGSNSNYGLKLYNRQMLPGMSLSLDISQQHYSIPDTFAANSKQALEGKIKIFSAQSENYVNGYYNGSAITRVIPNISNPKYISINNAFGRPWHANAPYGIKGSGLVSVSDPNGRPLANPPSIENGGVFFGEVSNRIYGKYKTNTSVRTIIPGNLARETSQQYMPGNLKAATIGTVFMGVSPDNSNFAVFASIAANGSLSQIHMQDGVDGLIDHSIIEPHKDETTSVGAVFRWSPNKEIFISDYYADRIAVIELASDEKIFHAESVSYITSPEINKPVDIAAAIPEIANPRFSSNTTLAGRSNIYVANKNGTILLMSQKGKILAKAKVVTDFKNSLNGEIKNISTSYDAQTIFIAMEGKNDKDFIVKIPAFNADGFYSVKKKDQTKIVKYQSEQANTKKIPEINARLGKHLFTKNFGLKDDIRHVFNATSCVTCHNDPVIGGFNPDENNFIRRVAKYNKKTGHIDGIESYNYPVAKLHDIRLFGEQPEQKAGIPSDANIVSMRMPLSLLHIGKIDEIPDVVLLSHARSKGDGIQGRVNYINTEQGKKIGRYGWKASHVSLRGIVANSLATQIGIDNSYTSNNLSTKNEVGNEYVVEAITKYLQEINNFTEVAKYDK